MIRNLLTYAAFFVCSMLARGENPPAGGDRLRALPIEGGAITHCQRDDSATLQLPDGSTQTGLPPRTIVHLLLHPAKRSNIHVELWLPDAENWNGRFLGLGNGGPAGRINPGSLTGPIASGYAVATTDLGTAPDPGSGVGNPEVWRDFGFRATHLMTVVGRQLSTAFYGRPPEFSYFSGSSTGGQQALQEAQRYPEDYDGILATLPAHCRTPLHAYFLWNDQVLHQRPFTKEQEAGIIAAANETLAARETPPVAGKFLSDPRATAPEIEAVIALAVRKDPTLTPEHAAALRKLFDGPKHAVTGERIFNGVPLGSSLSAAHGGLYLFQWVFGAEKDLQTINFGADIDAYTAALGPLLNAENPDLSAFEKHGGKLLVTTGAADAVVPASATLDYYERVIEHCGSVEKTQSFFRLFLVPGMAHGAGPGLTTVSKLLESVRAWREHAAAPEVLQGRRIVAGKTELEMPLYPYPVRTSWDAETGRFHRAEGPRGGIERVAERFRPAARE